MNSSSLWLGGGVVLLALYLAAVRASTVALDASAVVLIVVVGCFCVYTAASLGRLMKNKPEERQQRRKRKQKRLITRTESQKICGFSGFCFSASPRRAQSCRAGFMAFIKFFSVGTFSLRAKREPESTRYFRGAGGTN